MISEVARKVLDVKAMQNAAAETYERPVLKLITDISDNISLVLDTEAIRRQNLIEKFVRYAIDVTLEFDPIMERAISDMDSIRIHLVSEPHSRIDLLKKQGRLPLAENIDEDEENIFCLGVLDDDGNFFHEILIRDSLISSREDTLVIINTQLQVVLLTHFMMKEGKLLTSEECNFYAKRRSLEQLSKIYNTLTSSDSKSDAKLAKELGGILGGGQESFYYMRN